MPNFIVRAMAWKHMVWAMRSIGPDRPARLLRSGPRGRRTAIFFLLAFHLFRSERAFARISSNMS